MSQESIDSPSGPEVPDVETEAERIRADRLPEPEGSDVPLADDALKTEAERIRADALREAEGSAVPLADDKLRTEGERIRPDGVD